MTGTNQAVRFHVFGKHRQRNVLKQNDIQTFAFNMLHLPSPLRAGQRNNQKGDSQKQQACFGYSTPRRKRHSNFRKHRNGSKSGCQFFPPMIRIDKQQQKERQRKQAPQKIRLGKSHGILTNRVFESTSSSKIKSAPAKSQG